MENGNKRTVWVLDYNRIYRGEDGYIALKVSDNWAVLEHELSIKKSEILEEMKPFCKDDALMLAENIVILKEDEFIYDDKVNYRHELKVVKSEIDGQIGKEVYVGRCMSDGEPEGDIVVFATREEAFTWLVGQLNLAIQDFEENGLTEYTVKRYDNSFQISTADGDRYCHAWFETVQTIM